jgi:hypothetical protein
VLVAESGPAFIIKKMSPTWALFIHHYAPGVRLSGTLQHTYITRCTKGKVPTPTQVEVGWILHHIVYCPYSFLEEVLINGYKVPSKYTRNFYFLKIVCSAFFFFSFFFQFFFNVARVTININHNWL